MPLLSTKPQTWHGAERGAGCAPQLPKSLRGPLTAANAQQNPSGLKASAWGFLPLQPTPMGDAGRVLPSPGLFWSREPDPEEEQEEGKWLLPCLQLPLLPPPHPQ